MHAQKKTWQTYCRLELFARSARSFVIYVYSQASSAFPIWWLLYVTVLSVFVQKRVPFSSTENLRLAPGRFRRRGLRSMCALFPSFNISPLATSIRFVSISYFVLKTSVTVAYGGKSQYFVTVPYRCKCLTHFRSETCVRYCTFLPNRIAIKFKTCLTSLLQTTKLSLSL